MINIAKQFSEVPAGRYLTDGAYSGERFREELLLPRLNDSDVVVVKIDGTAGYGSSFLEEAFGGLVRFHHFTPGELRQKLRIESDDPSYRVYEAAIWKFIDSAQPERA